MANKPCTNAPSVDVDVARLQADLGAAKNQIVGLDLQIRILQARLQEQETLIRQQFNELRFKQCDIIRLQVKYEEVAEPF